MKRFIQTILFCLLASVYAEATHNRAGEITLVQLDEFTYEITITTFTYTLSQADRSQLEVQWGDNTISSAGRISITKLPNYYQKNIYTARHTFPGPGTYQIVVQDPNRNLGVKNIPNSVNVIFSIKTTITINPSIGPNSTPILLNPPIDRAALGQIFIHNPAAYDPDGDSISYRLTTCTEEDGKPIEGYTLPSHSDTIYVDPITGDLVWIRPDEIGIYNIAIDVEEWRQGVKIGNIVRDMQIEVYETDNRAPTIDSIGDFCVEAGSVVAFRVKSNDPDGDSINLSATGGPFVVESNPAQFTTDASATSRGHYEASFVWQTDCSHARQQVYTVVVKAEDNDPETKLVDLETVNIKVIAKAPDAPFLVPSSNSITASWNPDPCESVIGYHLYRRAGPSGYVHDTCTNGLPLSTGYELVGILTDRYDTIYSDENGGRGLEQGAEYCYIVVSIYPDGSFSFPSEESCSPLVAGTPSFLQVSVTNDSPSGDIELRWAEPQGLDTLPVPAEGPFEYIITRYTDLFGNEEDEVFIKQTPDISDTVFVDGEADTRVFPYSYQIRLFNNAPGKRFEIGDPEIQPEKASSMYPELVGKDNQIEISMVKSVPWINYDYTIYRDDGSGSFVEIAFTTESKYVDKGLINNKEYCYRVVSTGWRSIEGRLFENSNISHVNCTEPVDSIAPCTPMLNGQSNCDEFYNHLNWFFLNDSCLEDVDGYRLYYSPTESGIPELIREFENKTDTSYQDFRIDESLTGCYYITAVDSFNNESPRSAQLCLDECSNYVLPNVFSPNNDDNNDLYIPLRTAYVERVDFQVYNRWGLLVFNTDDPDIYWDGKINGTDQLVSPGVYYYICEVFEPRIGGLESYTLTGFIYVFSGDENNVFIEK